MAWTDGDGDGEILTDLGYEGLQGQVATGRPRRTLDCVEPGVQSVHRWRPDDTSPDGPTDAEVDVYGDLSRIP